MILRNRLSDFNPLTQSLRSGEFQICDTHGPISNRPQMGAASRRNGGLFSAGLIALAALAMPQAALAGEASAVMAVSLTVEESCSVSASPMNFAMQSDDGANGQAQSDIALSCTPGTQFEVAIDSGTNAQGDARRLIDPATGAAVNYEIYADAGRSQVWGDGASTVGGDSGATGQRTITAYGEVRRNGRIAPGTYSDMVVVSVNF